MANKSPIFPMPDPQHFSDYGFDPQIDYFQFLEEARNHKRESNTTSFTALDSLQFNLQKPDEKTQKENKKKRWWKKAFLFFKWKWIQTRPEDPYDVYRERARAFRGSISGPVYVTESRSGSSTPYRTTSRPSSGPIAGNSTPARKGDLEIPYLSLRQLSMEQQELSNYCSAKPIYLVT